MVRRIAYSSLLITFLFLGVQTASADQFWLGSGTNIYNNNTGYIGIGTDSPSAKLMIYGSPQGATDADYAANVTKLATSFSISNRTASMVGMFDASALPGFDGGGPIYAADMGLVYDDSGYQITFSTNNDTSDIPSERMRIDSSGRVGIGTTGMYAYRDSQLIVRNVADNAGIGIETGAYGKSASLRFYKSQQQAASIGFNTSDGSMHFSVNDNTSSPSVFRMTSSGRFGIGTYPAVQLHVHNSSMGNTQIARFSSNPEGTGTYNYISVGDRSAGDYAMFGYMHSGQTTLTGAFVAAGPGGSPNSGMFVRYGGNVGIGTSSPQRSLHINDVLRLEPRAAAPSAAALGDIYVDNDTNEFCFYNGTAWKGIANGGACA